jgi:hypothetical protein
MRGGRLSDTDDQGRRAWTTKDKGKLKKHLKSKTPVTTISRTLKRTPGALRQNARLLGI